MRKLLATIVFIISLSVLLLAMNQSFINRVKQDRYFDHLRTDSTTKASLYQRIFMRSDRWSYGDLYGISFLHQYKHQLEPFKKYPSTNNKPTTKRTLYIIGDSFTADKTLDGAFEGFDQVIFLDRRFPYGPIALNTSRQNYLVMEFAEHNLLNYNLQTSTEQLWTPKEINECAFLDPKTAEAKASKVILPKGAERINRLLFNKDLSRNLETILFDDKMFTPLKELKAAFNYHVLNRLPKEVAVSTDKKRLLLGVTVDTSLHESSFNPKSNPDIEAISQRINDASNYYKSIGFKQVFLAIIPNPVSVYDEHRMPYNHLTERIEQTTSLPVISVYNRIKKDKRNLFYVSDAHWNPLGFDIWVMQANSVLKANVW